MPMSLPLLLRDAVLSPASIAMLCVLSASSPQAHAAASAGWHMRHSDVVFMYTPATPTLYDAYHASVVLWGSAGAAEVATLHGVHAQGNIWFLTAWGDRLAADPEMLRSVCVDIEGKPIEVPWLTDLKRKLPNYWGCTNAPYYRAYLLQQAVAQMKPGVAGLHIDDHCGTAACASYAGGCFCRYCMAGFRAYLKAHYSATQLAALGVTDVDTFDYAAYVRHFATTRKEYIERRFNIPLFMPFIDFQTRAESEMVGEVRAACARAAGHPISVSANCGLPAPLHLADYAHLDVVAGEIELRASAGKPSDTSHFAYKVADAIDRPLASTGSGWDWSWIGEHNKPGLVRIWIAESYAFGHRLMAPHHQWAYTPEKGSHWWDGRTEDFAPLYAFVATHRDLFDGFEPLSDVALIYDTPAVYRGRDHSSEAAAYLAEHNAQYRVAIAGGDWVDARLSARALRGAQRVIVTSKDLPDARQAAIVDALRRDGKVIDWTGPASCDGKLPESVRGGGATGVWALVRRNRATGAVAVHLLNRNYALEQDAVRPTGPLTVSIDGALLGRRTFRSAAVYTVPDDAASPATIRSTRDGTTITVPGLGLWSIMLLKP